MSGQKDELDVYNFPTFNTEDDQKIDVIFTYYIKEWVDISNNRQQIQTKLLRYSFDVKYISISNKNTPKQTKTDPSSGKTIEWTKNIVNFYIKSLIDKPNGHYTIAKGIETRLTQHIKNVRDFLYSEPGSAKKLLDEYLFMFIVNAYERESERGGDMTDFLVSSNMSPSKRNMRRVIVDTAKAIKQSFYNSHKIEVVYLIQPKEFNGTRIDSDNTKFISNGNNVLVKIHEKNINDWYWTFDTRIVKISEMNEKYVKFIEFDVIRVTKIEHPKYNKKNTAFISSSINQTYSKKYDIGTFDTIDPCLFGSRVGLPKTTPIGFQMGDFYPNLIKWKSETEFESILPTHEKRQPYVRGNVRIYTVTVLQQTEENLYKNETSKLDWYDWYGCGFHTFKNLVVFSMIAIGYNTKEYVDKLDDMSFFLQFVDKAKRKDPSDLLDWIDVYVNFRLNDEYWKNFGKYLETQDAKRIQRETVNKIRKLNVEIKRIPRDDEVSYKAKDKEKEDNRKLFYWIDQPFHEVDAVRKARNGVHY